MKTKRKAKATTNTADTSAAPLTPSSLGKRAAPASSRSSESNSLRASKSAKSVPAPAAVASGHEKATAATATTTVVPTTSGGPNAEPPSTPSVASAVLPPQTPVSAAPAALSSTPASNAERLARQVESWGVVSQERDVAGRLAPSLTTVETFVGTTVGVDSTGGSRLKAFTTTNPTHTKPDHVRVTNLSVEFDVDLDGLDNFGNKVKVSLGNRGKQSKDEEQLLRNVTCQILHAVWAKQNRGNVQANFAEYVEGSKNCVNAEGRIVVRTSYTGTRYVRHCSDGSLEHLATKGKLSPEMNFDAELTLQYWKYKGNYGVSASVHRIIVNPPQEPGQSSFVSGATEYGLGQ